ncbi:uncharacterized protein MONBRDRAFT_33145 [Monosiga brevicollis MX1]|uniref:NADH:flavin oxidoreductase/NADH oxidase N-terminal domain-containing protein n=1 Tax=Monosiga brevicollis TaxID=81824 RepID=A9V3Z0_MONBE|nr:uncharacterized protein MONBRDRAFT_33145 [Monosiga brevicollis MX1]EDQ87793.1 predicted protein [Monosiga brevicollis MX1]|eukprot:XP_001747326.1 hypothetical protein [Monosiga brevicollis MX1]
MAATTPYPTLLSEVKVGDLTLKNRVAMSAMTRARSIGRIPNDLNRDYYAQRASAGLIVTEGIPVTERGAGWIDVPGLYTQEQTEGWKKVVDAVHAKGGVIFAQLWHMGRQAHSSFFNGELPFGPSPIAIVSERGVNTADGSHAPYEVPHEMTVDEIKATVQEYKKAAANAKAAGFDGIELHGANGYLIDEFLQSCSNTRTDEYGGSVEKRFRFLNEILQAVLEVYPKERVGVRISPNGNFGGMGSDDFRETFLYVAEQVGKYEVAYLQVLDGLGFGFHEKGEPLKLTEIRPLLPKATALFGNVGYTAETAEETLAAGHADVIAFGRPYLGNPDLVERFANQWPLADGPEHGAWFSPDMPDRTKYNSSWGYSDQPTYQEQVKA